MLKNIPVPKYQIGDYVKLKESNDVRLIKRIELAWDIHTKDPDIPKLLYIVSNYTAFESDIKCKMVEEYLCVK